MRNEIRNIPASVHARLQRNAQSAGRPFQEIFYYYAMERFLYRLSLSEHHRRFVLKGGLAFLGWGIALRRPTRDIDLHTFMSNSQEEVERVIKEICLIQDEADGMIYDTSAIRLETIMADAKYEGVRVRFLALLGRASISLQIDISFANIITPGDIEVGYPTLLNAPHFHLRSYNRETAIAEKFQAMVFWGDANSRMKDFYDIYLLAKECNFEGSVLTKAFKATFDYRRTIIPTETPSALTSSFAQRNQDEWLAFLKGADHPENVPDSFEEVLRFLGEFLLPPMQSVANNEDFMSIWNVVSGWTLP